MKRMLALLLSLAMAFALVACGGNNTAGNNTADGGNTAGNQTEDTTGGDTAEATGSVYYMNFKPEQDAQWQELAAYYTEQTGVPVTVATYASGEYETMLTSEMAKDEAPTLFQVNGPVGLNNWRDYCYDLSGSAVYGELTSEDYALKDGDEVVSIGYVIESYGIIVNQTLLEQAGYTVDDIQSFEESEGRGRGHHRPQGRAGLLRLHLRRPGQLLRLALQDPPGQPAHLLRVPG